jgi:hypothetical protein
MQAVLWHLSDKLSGSVHKLTWWPGVFCREAKDLIPEVTASFMPGQVPRDDTGQAKAIQTGWPHSHHTPDLEDLLLLASSRQAFTCVLFLEVGKLTVLKTCENRQGSCSHGRSPPPPTPGPQDFPEQRQLTRKNYQAHVGKSLHGKQKQ